jgi:hypothetical protein
MNCVKKKRKFNAVPKNPYAKTKKKEKKEKEGVL